MKQIKVNKLLSLLSVMLTFFVISSCTYIDDKMDTFDDRSGLYNEEVIKDYPTSKSSGAVFLLIDEESIDNDNEPNK